MKIYLARPISGQSYDTVTNYYKETERILINKGYEVLCPMNGKAHLRTEIEFKAKGYGNPVSTNHAIIERDRWMVNYTDIVYANLLKAPYASIGTCMELAWAHDKGKHTIVVMEENNVHQHAFILEAADIVFSTHEEAINYLIELTIPISYRPKTKTEQIEIKFNGEE